MATVIKKVTLSASSVMPGEPLYVEVLTTAGDTIVTINGVQAAAQYLQFRSSGSFMLSISATSAGHSETKSIPITVTDPPTGTLPFPLIYATMDRYQPRTVVFTTVQPDIAAPNASASSPGNQSTPASSSTQSAPTVTAYNWDFGDSQSGPARQANANHDYTSALASNTTTIVQPFHVTLQVTYSDQHVVTVKRTIAVFSSYAFDKTVQHRLMPWTTGTATTTDKLTLQVACSFVINNPEDEDLVFNEESHEWIQTETYPAKTRPPLDNVYIEKRPDNLVNAALLGALDTNTSGPAPATPGAAATGSSALRKITDSFIPTLIKIPLLGALAFRVPARSARTYTRNFPLSAFKGEVFGVGLHLRGAGVSSQTVAYANAYIEVKFPLYMSKPVSDPAITRMLHSLARVASVKVVSHADVQTLLISADAAFSPGQTSAVIGQTVPIDGTSILGRPVKPINRALQHPVIQTITSTPAAQKQSSFDLLTTLSIPNDRLISPYTQEFDVMDQVVVGAECDPENLPDNLPDGMVCQLTAESEWRYVPGRILNAKKGDVLLDPGGPGLVGQLLRQVTPPQYYSHCGIMTKNYIELRHSTGSEDWLEAHPAGSFLGNKGTDGFDEAALKYLWPGTVTQAIDDAYYGTQWLTSPDGPQYQIADFSFAPDASDTSHIVYPKVVKPDPFLESTDIRTTLHGIADRALAINAHYRFYCYTKPEIALGPEGIAGPDAGWANGTVATVCSSFIWLAAKQLGISLEGPDQDTTTADLETGDVAGGAACNNATVDGLYLYSAKSRLAAGEWLYNNIYNTAHNKAGWLGTLFTDAPDNVANQICNTFASDYAGDGSINSDDWKNTTDANAVSPDNIMFWDGPGTNAPGGFHSFYGYNEDLFYQPGTYALVPIYRWKMVATKGVLTGTVVADGSSVAGAVVSLTGSGLADTAVGPDGSFSFSNVPAGDYTITAFLNINNYPYQASQAVHIDGGKTTNTTITLLPPPAIYRLITVSVNMTTDWWSVFAHSPQPYIAQQSVKVHPFHSHEHMDFPGWGGDPHGTLSVDIDLNADLSVTLNWTASQMDGDDTLASDGKNYVLPQDYWVSWHVHLGYSSTFSSNHTDMDFTVNNDQAPQ